MSSLRLTSPNPHDRQIALLNLGLIDAAVHKRPFYVGQCSCEQALHHGILIMSNSPQERCLFCGQTIALTQIPTHKEALSVYAPNVAA